MADDDEARHFAWRKAAEEKAYAQMRVDMVEYAALRLVCDKVKVVLASFEERMRLLSSSVKYETLTLEEAAEVKEKAAALQRSFVQAVETITVGL